MSTRIPMLTGFRHNGHLHVITLDGRMWRQRPTLDGHDWEEVPGPTVEDAVPSWLRDQPAPPSGRRDFDARR
jgi:hypothetical protein